MEFFLDNPVRRGSFFLIVLLISAALCFLAAQRWWAAHLSQSSDPADLLKAAEIEPGNAEHWHRLGRFRQYDFERADLPLAVSYYERATQLDPRSARYWMDLAAAYEMIGRTAQAESAFKRAKAAYPISAQVAWHFGNFLIRRGDLKRGFAEIRRAVAADKNLIYPAVSVCWRASGDANLLLDEVLPHAGVAYSSALNYLLEQKQVGAALVVWRRWVALNDAFELRPAFALIELLLRDQRWDDAKTVWQKSLQAAGGVVDSSAPGSLVWDGNFERDFLNGGFGWRQRSITGATIGFETGAAGARSRALRIEFDGTANLDFQHVTQLVLVEPGRRYRFRAKLRTSEISTDSGVQFLIRPRLSSDSQFLVTPALVGTNDWTDQELEFTTGSATHLLEIIVFRSSSRKFDNKIKGTVWVSGVSLEPAAVRGGVR